MRPLMWKAIPGFSSYIISEYGVVIRVRDGRTRKVGHRPKQSRSSKDNKFNYFKYKLTDDGGTKCSMAVHILVAITFHGPRPSPKHQVAHWDDNKTNNHYKNVRWATSKQNHADARRNGTRDPRGEGNARARMTEELVIWYRRRFNSGGVSISALARAADMSFSAMSSALFGEHWPNLPYVCKRPGQGNRFKKGEEQAV